MWSRLLVLLGAMAWAILPSFAQAEEDDSEMEDSESQDVQSDSILLSISQELRNQTLTRIIDLQVP